MDFPDLLSRFAAAVQENDGAGLAALFTADGIYDDGFYGEYKGAQAIAGMLAHFHDTGTKFQWDFFDPLTDGRIGYARYRFSYASKMKGAEGKPVVFEGTAFFTLAGDKIAHYREVFDRGVALVQAGFRRRTAKEDPRQGRRAHQRRRRGAGASEKARREGLSLS